MFWDFHFKKDSYFKDIFVKKILLWYRFFFKLSFKKVF